MVRIISCDSLGMDDLYGDPEVDGVVFDSSESSIPVTQRTRGKKRKISYQEKSTKPNMGKVTKIEGGIKFKIGGARVSS